MPQTIITILGLSGAVKERDGCIPKRDENGSISYHSALYRASVIGKPDANCKNATQYVLEHYEGRFFFIGTACAIAFQKVVLKQELKGKEVAYIEVEDNSLDDIFEAVQHLIEEHDDIVLDITHGYRHQPLMAIFASTLTQFLGRKTMKIIFAKEVEMHKIYEYVYLDNYVDITHISLLLTGFIRTLNFIPVKRIGYIRHKIFEDFSKSLLSNDLRGVENHFGLLQKELASLKQNQALSHIGKLLEKVDKELQPLVDFGDKPRHLKYLVLYKMTVQKNYLVVALAYLFESLRVYCDSRFKEVCEGITYKSRYERKQDVMGAITNADAHFDTQHNKIYKKHPNFYANNKARFERISTVYQEIRTLRNTLAHINETKEFDDIKQMIVGLSFKVESLFRDDPLKVIKI